MDDEQAFPLIIAVIVLVVFCVVSMLLNNSADEAVQNDIKAPKITERPPRFGNIDEWMKVQNTNIKEYFDKTFDTYGKRVMTTAQTCNIR